MPLALPGFCKHRCIPPCNGRNDYAGNSSSAKYIFHHCHYSYLLQQFLAYNQINGKYKRTDHTKQIAGKGIVCQIIAALRQDTQHRTAKPQSYTDNLHYRSFLVQKENGNEKYPYRLHRIEYGTRNRSSLADAQQIAEHKSVKPERPEAKQHDALLPGNRRFFYKTTRQPKSHCRKHAPYGNTR